MSKCLQLLVIGNEILSGRRQDVHFANTRAAMRVIAEAVTPEVEAPRPHRRPCKRTR